MLLTVENSNECTKKKESILEKNFNSNIAIGVSIGAALLASVIAIAAIMFKQKRAKKQRNSFQSNLSVNN